MELVLLAGTLFKVFLSGMIIGGLIVLAAIFALMLGTTNKK